MYSLSNVKDFDELEGDILNFANPKKNEIVKSVIMDYLDEEVFRLETIIENLISYNEQIFSLMADYLLDNNCIDIEPDETEEEVHTQTMDYLRDKYLGHNVIDTFENIIYETVMECEIPLIIDLDSFHSYDIVVLRVSREAKYIDTTNLDYDVNFHINHAQRTMFDLDGLEKEGGCWHYGRGNILIIDDGAHRKGRMMLGG